MLLHLVDTADKYFIRGISKSFHSLEDSFTISFKNAVLCSDLLKTEKQKLKNK